VRNDGVIFPTGHIFPFPLLPYPVLRSILTGTEPLSHADS
jgi:hypothetical protein